MDYWYDEPIRLVRIDYATTRKMLIAAQEEGRKQRERKAKIEARNPFMSKFTRRVINALTLEAAKTTDRERKRKLYNIRRHYYKRLEHFQGVPGEYWYLTDPRCNGELTPAEVTYYANNPREYEAYFKD